MLVIQNVIGGFAAGYEWDESLFEFLNSTDFKETSYPDLDFNLEEKKFKIELKKQCRLKRLMQHYCVDCQQLSDITSAKYHRTGKKCENNGCNGLLLYKCIECGRMFKEIFRAYKHLRDTCSKPNAVHNKSLPRLTRDVRYNPYNKDGFKEAFTFPCSKCERKFTTFKGQACHEKRYCKYATSNVNWTETASDNLMDSTSAPAAPKSDFACSKCARNFLTLKGLKIHMSHRCGKSDNSSDSCPNDPTENVDNYVEVDDDDQTLAPKSNLTCQTCDQSFQTLKGLKIHMSHRCGRSEESRVGSPSTHTIKIEPTSATNSDFPCQKCDQSFLTSKGLKIHMSHRCGKSEKSGSFSSTAPIDNIDNQTSAPKSNLTCQTCDQSFQTPKGLKIHMSHRCGRSEESRVGSPSTHTIKIEPTSATNSDFPCQKCDQSFLTSKGLKIHMSYGCGKSEQSSDFSLKAAIENVDHHTPEPKSNLICQTCDQSFLTPKGLKIHMSHRCSRSEYLRIISPSIQLEDCIKTEPTLATKSEFRCQKCDQNFLTSKGLKIHMSHGCGKSVKSDGFSPKAITEIVKNQTSARKSNFPCPKCNQNFLTSKGLKIHMSHRCGRNEESRVVSTNIQPIDTIKIESTLSTNRDFICHLCDQNFLTSEELEIHMSLECEKSKDADASVVALNTQSDTTVKTEPTSSTSNFSCSKCDRTFESIYGLRSHMSMSSLCGKNFKKKRASQFSFRKISRKHVSSSLFCPKCSKKCVGIIGLRLHLNRYCIKNDDVSHTTGPPASVSTNESTHQDPTPNSSFACIDCRLTFSNINALRCHVNFHCKKMKSLNTTTCEKCFQKFGSVKRLRLHRHFCPVLVNNFNATRRDGHVPVDSPEIDQSTVAVQINNPSRNDDPAMQVDAVNNSNTDKKPILQINDFIENQPLWKR
ncbi:gastrula zinc finger protein xFG20-1-like [Copidosoma floridanum]|uniref:gastrula zinc finger protein xFG20-1-like n=1 Tax=Copidosoma floridanum TaxID=29053 RepID=UPI0006C9C9F6|nr:gastrula zinc finger protein xFG20-1-like [Copidosoma floridanum]